MDSLSQLFDKIQAGKPGKIVLIPPQRAKKRQKMLKLWEASDQNCHNFIPQNHLNFVIRGLGKLYTKGESHWTDTG